MTRAKRIVAACAVTIGAWAATAVAFAADQLILPAGARVGIIEMMPSDLTHYHVGRSRLGSFMRTYRMSWPVSEVLDGPIASMLKARGLEPVFVQPTDPLRHKRQSWIVSNPFANRLPGDAAEEIGRILIRENLQGLVIVAPGSNTSPELADGDRLRKLPSYVQGWGFSTSDEPNGIAKPVVFNLTQMLLVGRGRDEAELIFREWGGAFLHEWPGFQPGADLKALSAADVAKFQPVMADMLRNQIDRLTPRIRVADPAPGALPAG
jgi:hypothetical protein